MDENNVDYKLGTCCQKAGVELVNAHRAMADVEATADLFRYLVNCLRSNTQSVSEVVDQKVEENRFRSTFEI
jgi:DNA polymerase III alpha subunit (gram-positive type)